VAVGVNAIGVGVGKASATRAGVVSVAVAVMMLAATLRPVGVTAGVTLLVAVLVAGAVAVAVATGVAVGSGVGGAGVGEGSGVGEGGVVAVGMTAAALVGVGGGSVAVGAPSATGSSLTGVAAPTATTAEVGAGWLTSSLALASATGIVVIVMSGCKRAPRLSTSAATRAAWRCVHATGPAPPSWVNKAAAKSKISTIGAPHASRRGGAGCSSRPQCGQTTNAADARPPQRRQRICLLRDGNDSPHAGQREALTLTGV